jgi:hypothetical protein
MDIYFVYVFFKTKLQEEEMINNKKWGKNKNCNTIPRSPA